MNKQHINKTVHLNAGDPIILLLDTRGISY